MSWLKFPTWSLETLFTEMKHTQNIRETHSHMAVGHNISAAWATILGARGRGEEAQGGMVASPEHALAIWTNFHL